MAVRVSARVLLLDPDGRLLLFRGIDPAEPGAPFWFTVGGAVEPGETLADAALRELREETGVLLPAERLTGPVWRRDVTFSFDRTSYVAEEWFFLARLDRTPAVDVGGFNEVEAATISTHRWWSAEELRVTGETVYPGALGELLDSGWDGRVRSID